MGQQSAFNFLIAVGLIAMVRRRPFAGGIGFAEWDDAHQQVSQYLS